MISIDEINELYRTCGIKNTGKIIRTTINTGTLNNCLNTNQVATWGNNINPSNSTTNLKK